MNQPLLAKCKYLREYSTLVGKVEEGIRAGLTRKEAISRAVKFCLDNGLMDQDKAIRASYEDGRDDEWNQSIALKMIWFGKPLEDILHITDLPIEKITELATKIGVINYASRC